MTHRSSPTQNSLDELLDRVTLVRVIEAGERNGTAMGNHILGETSDPETIRILKQSLQIKPAWGSCMCFGNYALQMYSGSALSATIGYHHGSSIRWSAWAEDAMLKNPAQVLDWFSKLGIDGPALKFQEKLAHNSKQMDSMARWKEAIPPCLNPHVDEVMADRFDAALPSNELMQALRASYEFRRLDSCAVEMVRLRYRGLERLSFLRKFSRENFISFPTRDILRALAAGGLTGEQLGGAARYFFGWQFHKTKGADAQLLSYNLKVRLLKHSLDSDNQSPQTQLKLQNA